MKSLLRTYYEQGYSVIPCHRGTNSSLDKRPCIKSWKPFQERRASEEELQQWERSFPNCNVAIVTGRISDVVVLDVDSRAGHQVIMRHGPFPMTPCVQTRSGYHLYFKHPGVHTRNFVKQLPGCDFRGDGAYIIAAGSRHPSGLLYRWARNADLGPLPVPAWLLPYIVEPVRPARTDRAPIRLSVDASDWAVAALRSEISRLDSIPLEEGNGKNNAFFQSAARLGEIVGAGLLSEATVRDVLMEIWTGWGKPLAEGIATLDSGICRGKAQPRYPAPRRRAAR